MDRSTRFRGRLGAGGGCAGVGGVLGVVSPCCRPPRKGGTDRGLLRIAYLDCPYGPPGLYSTLVPGARRAPPVELGASGGGGGGRMGLRHSIHRVRRFPHSAQRYVCPQGSTTGYLRTGSNSSKHIVQWKEKADGVIVNGRLYNQSLVCTLLKVDGGISRAC